MVWYEFIEKGPLKKLDFSQNRKFTMNQGECETMKIHKKIAAALAAVAILVSASVSALAVAPGYSDYGASDTAQVTPGQAVGQLVAPDTGVSVDIPADVLPQGVTQVTMAVAAKDSAAFKTAIDNAAKLGYEDVEVLDIVLLDQNGNPISKLNGEVTVTVPANGSQNSVLYISDDHNVTDMKATLQNRYLSFKTNHFSYYAAATLTKEAAGVPQTGDSATTVIVVGVMSVAALGILIASVKARKARAK